MFPLQWGDSFLIVVNVTAALAMMRQILLFRASDRTMLISQGCRQCALIHRRVYSSSCSLVQKNRISSRSPEADFRRFDPRNQKTPPDLPAADLRHIKSRTWVCTHGKCRMKPNCSSINLLPLICYRGPDPCNLGSSHLPM